MNEFEQKALKTLSDEEREKVIGGKKVNDTTELTAEECNKLKDMVDIPGRILCKYGGPGMFEPKAPYPVAIEYGGPGKFKHKIPITELPDEEALSPTPPTEDSGHQNTEV